MKKTIVLGVSLITVVAVLLAAFFVPVTVGGKEAEAKLGSPNYIEPPNWKGPPPKFGGVIKETAAESTAW